MALDQKKKSQNVLKYVNKQMSLLLIIFYVSQIVFCFFFYFQVVLSSCRLRSSMSDFRQ